MNKRQSNESSNTIAKKRATQEHINNGYGNSSTVSRGAPHTTTSTTTTSATAAATNNQHSYFDDDTQYFHTQFIRKIDEAVRQAPGQQFLVPASPVAPQPNPSIHQLSHCFGFSQDLDSQYDETITSGQQYKPPSTQATTSAQHSTTTRQEWADSLDNSMLLSADTNTAIDVSNDLKDLKSSFLDDNDDELLSNIDACVPQSSQQFLSDVKQFVGQNDQINSDHSMIFTNTQLDQIDVVNFVAYQSNRTMNEYLALQRTMHEENEQNVHEDNFAVDRQNVSTQFHRKFESTFNECERTIRGLDETNVLNELLVENNVPDYVNNTVLDLNLNYTELAEEFNSTYSDEVIRGRMLEMEQQQQTDSFVRPNVPVPAALFCNKGPFYGMPVVVKSLIKEYKGINDLYGENSSTIFLHLHSENTQISSALRTIRLAERMFTTAGHRA